MLWWVSTADALIKKLKEVQSSLGKCKKLHNYILSHSWRTALILRQYLPWRATWGGTVSPGDLRRGGPGNYSVKDHGNRERFLKNNVRGFFKNIKKQDLGRSSLVTLTSEPRWRLWNKYS